MHLRQLNLSINNAIGRSTAAPSGPQSPTASSSNANVNAIIQVVTTIIIIIMAVVFVSCALFYCFRGTFANGCCGVDGAGEEDDQANNGNGGRRRRPPGLSRAVIDTFPTYLYSDVRVHRLGTDELECAVCLNEFKDVEILRVLPTCCHVFHTDCIDTWLLSRATCPVCRANVGSISDLTEQEGRLGSILGISGFDEENNHIIDEILIEQSPIVQIRIATPDTSTNNTRWLTCNRPKSHSTGHSPMWTAQQTDRFTLRLPEEVRYMLVTGSAWPRGGVMGMVSSPRSWYRHPSNIVGWCRNNGVYVVRKSNYHRFRTGNNNTNLGCISELARSSNALVSWSASPKSDGPIDYSSLNAQR